MGPNLFTRVQALQKNTFLTKEGKKKYWMGPLPGTLFVMVIKPAGAGLRDMQKNSSFGPGLQLLRNFQELQFLVPYFHLDCCLSWRRVNTLNRDASSSSFLLELEKATLNTLGHVFGPERGMLPLEYLESPPAGRPTEPLLATFLKLRVGS